MAKPYAQVIKALRDRGLLPKIQSIASDHYVTMHELCSGSRVGSILKARHAAWKWQRSIGHSYPQIGEMWGYDHTTIMHAVNGGQAHRTEERKRSKKRSKKGKK
jgi:chromosomal replication initiation ATPase DnaA